VALRKKKGLGVIQGGSGEQGNGLAYLVFRLEPQLVPRDLLSSATDTDSSLIGP